MPIFLHILPAPLYTVAIARLSSLWPYKKSSLLLFQPSLYSEFNFIVGSKFLFHLGHLCLDRTSESHLAPGQDYVAVPPSAFPPMFLLSQRRCEDARCHGGDRRFWL